MVLLLMSRPSRRWPVITRTDKFFILELSPALPAARVPQPVLRYSLPDHAFMFEKGSDGDVGKTHGSH